MKHLLARFLLWLCEDFCEYMHHFQVLPSGAPGCIMNWRWRGYGPNRWACWAMDFEERRQNAHNRP